VRKILVLVCWLAGLGGVLVTARDLAAQQPAAAPAKPASGQGQPILPPEMMEPITKLSRSIEAAEGSIQQLKELEGELSRLRSDVERIIYESTSAADGLRPQLAEVKDQIEKLGPPPKSGEPPESETIAAERARLNAMAGALDSAIKTTELAWVRAKQLIDRITVMRYQMFARNLFERRDSPLLPGVWRELLPRMETVGSRIKYYAGDWMEWAARRSNEVFAVLLLACLVAGGGAAFVRQAIAKVQQPRTPSPQFFERARQAAWIVPARMAPWLIGVATIYLGFSELDLLFPPWGGVALVASKGLLVFIAASALLRTSLAPDRPGWRLIPVANETARQLTLIFLAFVGVYVLDTILVELNRAVYAPLAVTVAQSFFVALINVALLVRLLLTRFEPQIGSDRPVNGHEYVPGIVTRHTPIWVKLPLWLVTGLIVGSSFLGYVALARFISHQIVLTGLVGGAVLLLYLAIRAAARGKGEGTSLIGETLGAKFGLEGQRRNQLARLVELTGTLVLFLLAMPLLLIQWGFSGDNVRDWMRGLLFGFEVGQFRISLARILIGIVLFTALLFSTRLFQRWLREQVLAKSRLDMGIANSIDIAVGYAGSALALLLAVSYAGFDITSLAIVAGALSVGIGFGLQSIVNNFVSGLILLVERPIKVGDWIVIGGDQGNVRRISVRSTEIETFDRASVIVPNAELISGRVLNWTHRNQMGRSQIKITLDTLADPERVLKILLVCAQTNPDVLQSPPPSVTFDSFTSTSLEYTIRVVLADVYKGGSVATDLRVAVLRRLREEGLMPSPAKPEVASQIAAGGPIPATAAADKQA
jgi:potassium-dependent mechanosensitive channel